MGWFTKEKPGTDATVTDTAPVRVHSTDLSHEPRFTDLAHHCIHTVGPDHPADPVSVLTGIYNITTGHVGRCFTTLRRPRDAQAFTSLLVRTGFTEQYLWDYLTGDPGKIAIHNHLAEFLTSEQLHDTITTSIREGHHNPAT